MILYITWIATALALDWLVSLSQTAFLVQGVITCSISIHTKKALVWFTVLTCSWYLHRLGGVNDHIYYVLLYFLFHRHVPLWNRCACFVKWSFKLLWTCALTTSAETQAGTFSDNTFYLKQMLFQVEAFKSFISGKDTFVILPTGYGKSVIYGVLPLMFDYLLGEYSNIKN